MTKRFNKGLSVWTARVMLIIMVVALIGGIAISVSDSQKSGISVSESVELSTDLMVG